MFGVIWICPCPEMDCDRLKPSIAYHFTCNAASNDLYEDNTMYQDSYNYNIVNQDLPSYDARKGRTMYQKSYNLMYNAISQKEHNAMYMNITSCRIQITEYVIYNNMSKLSQLALVMMIIVSPCT